MLYARYEILLPQTYNDGTPVEQERFEQTWFELIDHFGALTIEPSPRRGVWTHQLERFEDNLVRVVLDLEDDPQVEQFMREYKESLKARFEQLEIWIVAFPIRII